jgi:hypothetical protein
MDGTVQINIRVRKYLWSEFVHDVCYVLYAAIMISNALSKRYLKLSLRQLLRVTLLTIKWTFWICMIGVWSYLLINGWLHPQ